MTIMMPHHHVTVRFNVGTILKIIFCVLFFALLFVVRDLVLVVLAAVVLASSVEPATKWFEKRKIARLPAVIVIYIILGLVLVGLIFFFIPLIANEAITYLNNLPDNLNLSDLWSPIGNWSFVGGDAAPIPQDLPVKDFVGKIRGIVTDTSGGLFKTASAIFGGALSFILIVVLSFYLAVQHDGVGNFLRVVTPAKNQKYIIDLWKRSQLKIGYWMQGQLLLGILIGVLVYLGLMILGVRHALLLASLAAVFELIPIFGPILSAIPAVLIGFVDGGVTMGVLVIGLYVIIQQFENHLIYPLVVKKIVGVSPIVVILSLVIGAKLAGFLGILLSVPIASVLMEYWSDVERGKRAAETEPAA